LIRTYLFSVASGSMRAGLWTACMNHPVVTLTAPTTAMRTHIFLVILATDGCFHFAVSTASKRSQSTQAPISVTFATSIVALRSPMMVGMTARRASKAVMFFGASSLMVYYEITTEIGIQVESLPGTPGAPPPPADSHPLWSAERGDRPWRAMRSVRWGSSSPPN